MNKYTLAGLSVTGGILLGLAWTPWCSGLILLIAFVPFFIIENYLSENRKRFSTNAFFIFILPGFVIFSIITMGWMRFASITGAICVILGLSFLMAFTTWLAHVVRLRAGAAAGIIAMIAFWLGYEYLSLNIKIISPWINLGNGLFKDILFIQWYDITGTAGGSLWILCSNVFLTLLLVNTLTKRRSNLLYIILWIIVIIIPAAFSVYRYNTISQNDQNSSQVVIVQPNTDPYSEKFSIPFEKQLKNVITMANTTINDSTDWLITPETTVDDPANLDDLKNDKYVKLLKKIPALHHGLNIVAGFVTYRLYAATDKAPTKSARRIDASGLFYDHFNSAVQIDSSNIFAVYHKSKLVPGIEMQFSNGPGRLISRILPYLGGTKWGYGIQNERTCFENTSGKLKIAPIICYESVFGEFVTGYVKKGAGALFIITNDGWWKNTDGYKQHLYFASLRAIETRRQVARAANTGISCLIDIRGKRIAETRWWKKAILKGEIYPETRITTYVKYGDYLLRISCVISVFILINIFIIKPVRKKLNHSEK